MHTPPIIIISTQMSSFEDFKQTLAPEQLEFFEARIASDREQYEKVKTLVQQVHADDNARLPFIPIFYRRRSVEAEQALLDRLVPRVELARGEEFCLTACERQGPSCLQSCKEFAGRAFELGGNLFATLHKPYRFTNFEEAEE